MAEIHSSEIFSLREGRPDDLDAMYALDLECFEPPYRFSRAAMRRFATAKNAVTLAADVAATGELAGFLIAHREREVFYIVTLDVAARFRRCGLARRLMLDLESRVRTVGAREIALHVSTQNPGAVRFYEALGYDRARMAENFYAPGRHALVYRKTLD